MCVCVYLLDNKIFVIMHLSKDPKSILDFDIIKYKGKSIIVKSSFLFPPENKKKPRANAMVKN